MDLRAIKAGDVVQLETGAVAEFREALEDGLKARLFFIESPYEPELEGKEETVSADLVVGICDSADPTRLRA